MGRSRPTAVRHLRRGGRPGVRSRSRRGLASGIRVRLRVPRVRSDRMRRSLRGATHDRAPVRGVPPRDGGDAEQLADRRAADPGRGRPDVRHVQDQAVRAPERLRLSSPRWLRRPGLRRVEQGERARRRPMGRRGGRTAAGGRHVPGIRDPGVLLRVGRWLHRGRGGRVARREPGLRDPVPARRLRSGGVHVREPVDGLDEDLHGVELCRPAWPRTRAASARSSGSPTCGEGSRDASSARRCEGPVGPPPSRATSCGARWVARRPGLDQHGPHDRGRGPSEVRRADVPAGFAEVSRGRARSRIASALPSRRDLPQRPGRPHDLAEGSHPDRVRGGRRRTEAAWDCPSRTRCRCSGPPRRRPAPPAAGSSSRAGGSTSSPASGRTRSGDRCCRPIWTAEGRGRARIPDDARAPGERGSAGVLRARHDRVRERAAATSASAEVQHGEARSRVLPRALEPGDEPVHDRGGGRRREGGPAAPRPGRTVGSSRPSG